MFQQKNAKLLDGSSKEDTKDLVERMNTKLEDLETFTRFKQRLCSLMTEWIEEAEDKPDLLNMNKLAAEIEDSEALSTDSGIEDENERILLAVIPNKYLLDLVEKRPKKHTYIYDRIKGNNAIYGICVYVPRIQTWYHMTECRPERAFKVSTPNAIPCDITQSYVKFNKLYIVSQHKSTIYIFNLESYEWDTLDFKQPVDDNAKGMSGSSGNRVYIVPVNESTMYLIVSLVGVGRRGQTGMHFKCFKLTSDNAWPFMFSTPVVEEYSQLKEFSAIYSQSNKELVIVYRGDFTVVIHRNTPDLEGPKFGILRPEMDCIDFDTCWVLEDDKNIRIVGGTFDEDVYLIRCKCQYDLKSREWTKSNKQITRATYSLPKKGLSPLPYEYTLSIGDKSCVWLFQGDTDNGSCLTEISVDSDDRFTVREHKPPPFSCASILAVGLVKQKLLRPLEPIKKYINEKVKKKQAYWKLLDHVNQ